MPPADDRPSVRELLLRRGLVFVASEGHAQSDGLIRALEIELAALGYVISGRLRARLGRASLDELCAFRTWAIARLSAHLGADREHEPLFRSFPDGIPDDTRTLWWQRVLVHFLQAEGQPCLFCRHVGRDSTTHVLDPCRHVVCDHCWDGASYAACPMCGQHVNRGSPFFKPAPPRGTPNERVTYRLLDLGESFEGAARALFESLCARKQALSPDDRQALEALVRELRGAVLPWVPAAIPVRENVALIFGTLLTSCPPDDVLPPARGHLKTATDVLRLVAVMSGTDGSLQPETVHRTTGKGRVSQRVHRFKIARMARPLRRALLALLEGMPPDRLVEDMLRHRSFWVWAGEFLHPHEYAARFPNVARAFAILRAKAPDGTPAPRFQGWSSRLEQAVSARDVTAVTALLVERPGELGRRLDHALRLAGDDAAAQDRVLAAFLDKVPALATPVLATLRSLLPTRQTPASVRVYWPKGKVARGFCAPDARSPLPARAVAPAVRAVEAELLRRFGQKPSFEDAVIDDALADIVAPFNERTASPSAVTLPRGSRVRAPDGKTLRLFLHWCEPEKGGRRTDLDLSIAFYDEEWDLRGECAYYHLRMEDIAQSGGDRTSAPWPDGATELVDLDRDRALARGMRYAVMVVNAYAGMPFGQLERAFAGLMLRDDTGGHPFDPRTVALKFALQGDHGVFVPLVLDVRERRIHWLDVHSKGELERNNVATSNASISRICPDFMAYFASGVRPSMLDLGLLHAAARCRRVFLRGEGGATRLFVRRPGEDAVAFHARLVRGEADEPRARPLRADGPPALSLLLHGDLALPAGSAVYALFRDQVVPTLAASDLLS